MNRKIIFKGWNNKYKCWDYVNNPMEDCALIDQNSVGQYTGIDDSKGKPIYEGDILFVKVLRADNYFEYYTDVIFEDGAFWIKGENTKDYDTLLYAYINPTSPLVELEVVGNVFSNPEILKGGEK
jgi:uncharacterized phage protein (TIGR01671 family)